ncbi:MAG: NUDIX hydrolase YfcD [Thermodesulfobacteriota bacterium]|nr:NUDIX hydrolase YfcD [Thermodesulfobacteriota bacterium]
MNSIDEIVAIVDENNHIIDSAPRSVMRAQNLPHRACYVLVFNSLDKILVQKRTQSKDVYPGYYDIATGGVVLAGETYEESAQRELAEEIGAINIPLRKHFDFFHQDSHCRVWGRVFSCRYDGKIILQKEEVESIDYHTIAEIMKLKDIKSFTPDGLYVLSRYQMKGLS